MTATNATGQALNSIERTQLPEPAFAKPWGNYLLDGFIETPAPEAISWLPSTPGWYFLLLLGVIFGGVKIYEAYIHYKKNAYRRAALSWLISFCTSDNKAVHLLPVLLKKVAVEAYGRAAVASLTGPKWDAWLDSECSQCQFVKLCPDLLARTSYISPEDISEHDRELLIAQIELWVRFHRGNND